MICAILLGWAIAATLWAYWSHTSLRKSYDHAVVQADWYRDNFGIMDDRSITYSDMATVISLDGRAAYKRPKGLVDGA